MDIESDILDWGLDLLDLNPGLGHGSDVLLANTLKVDSPALSAESADPSHSRPEGGHDMDVYEDVDMTLMYELDEGVQEIDAVHPTVDTRSR